MCVDVLFNIIGFNTKIMLKQINIIKPGPK